MVLTKPALANVLDLTMPCFRGLVFTLEPIKVREDFREVRRLLAVEAREEVFFFIGGVLRCCLPKVLDGCFNRAPVFSV